NNKLSEKSCPKCKNTQLYIKHYVSLLEDLGEIAESLGTRVEIISTETEEGETLLNTFGGIAALLRYKIHN
ncbi:MAG: peptide chain release factor aRF-1, partial [Promethearchaeota archaeon]